MSVELDATMLGDLFEDEGRVLLRSAARRTFDPDLALDMVAETFAIAFERRHSFRGGTRAEAVGWLFAISRTVIHHHFRHGAAERRALARLGVDLPTLDDHERARIEELAGLEELRYSLAGELNRLPCDQRRAVELRVVEERSYEDVAALLGVTPQTARARVSRGLRALGQALQLEGVTDAR
jgi:RNA polymerase sigma-70 factor, ECF subfamily